MQTDILILLILVRLGPAARRPRVYVSLGGVLPLRMFTLFKYQIRFSVALLVADVLAVDR